MDKEHNTDKHWYVLRAIFKKEIAVRDNLRRAGFHCYVPMTYCLKTVQGHKVRRLLPAITELVFVHAKLDAINDYKLHSKDTIYWMTKPGVRDREKIIVPDKAMNDFIRITQQKERAVTYFRPHELQLGRGDRIIIHGGPFDGVEGVLLKVKGKREKQLLVSLPGIAIAAVSISPEIIELISKQTGRSGESLHDAKELIRLSTQMLTAAPDCVSQTVEYDLLYQAISQLYAGLSPLRGYLPSQEGELSLGLFMAEAIISTITPDTRDRFMRAVSRLGDRSLLKLRMQLIGGTLMNDAALTNQSLSIMRLWKTDSLTAGQRHVIEVANRFGHLTDRNYTKF